MNAPQLTLYFDGQCPFCEAEMRRLRTWDRSGQLGFVDIAAPGFEAAQVGVSLEALNRELHSRTSDGQLLVGIDSMLAAYTLVGRGWLVAPLRMRGTRPICRVLYRAFARNRQRMSRWLGYRPAASCENGTCSIERNPFFK